MCVILTPCLGSFNNELSTPEKHLKAAPRQHLKDWRLEVKAVVAIITSQCRVSGSILTIAVVVP